MDRLNPAIFACATVLVWGTACGTSKYGAIAGVEPSSAGYLSFKTAVYPTLKTNCGSCHGAGQLPLHASSSSASSYNTVLYGHTPSGFPVALITEPSASRLLTKAIDVNHCPACGINIHNTLLTSLSAWATIETTLGCGSACGGGGGGATGYFEDTDPGYVTVPIQIPAAAFNNPCQEQGGNVCDSYYTVQFNLGSILPSAQNVRLNVFIQVYFNGYRVRSITLTQTNTTALNLHIADLRPLINGKAHPNFQGYRSIDATYTGGTLSLNNELRIVPQIYGAVSPYDFLSVKIGTLQ